MREGDTVQVVAESLRPIATYHGIGWFVSLKWKPTCFVLGAEVITTNPQGWGASLFIGPFVFLAGGLYRA